MTRILKVAALQEKAMPRASIKEKMEQRTLPLIEEAAKKGAQIILATELCTTDYDRCYGAKDNDLFKEAETIPGYSTNEVAKLCKKHGVYVIFPLFEKAVPGVYYNSSATIGPDGSIVGTYRKTQVAGVQALEKMYFRAGQDFKVHETVFEPHAKFGTIICHDRRYPETSRILAMLGAEVMFCPTAAPGYAHGVHWGNLNIMRAVDNGMFCVYSNRIGQEGVNNYFGESMIVDPMGEVIASGGKEENAVVMADLDLAKVDEARIKVPTLRDMRGAVSYTHLTLPTSDLV